MKLIEVTDEMFNSLMELSEDLNNQDHRCTRMPYMIQRSKKVQVAAYSGCGEEIWVNNEGDELTDIDEARDYVRNHIYENDENLNDSTAKYDSECIVNDMGDYEIYNYLEDITNESWRSVEVTEGRELENFFFTDKGLRDFYGKDVNTFLTGVRNPELELVMKFLCELSGGELHK